MNIGPANCIRIKDEVVKLNKTILIKKIIPVVIAFIGLWILLKSTIWGLNSANDYLRSVGGSMDSSQFAVIRESFMVSYRLLGSVLLGVGTFVSIRN
jgi:hypothetical protein